MLYDFNKLLRLERVLIALDLKRLTGKLKIVFILVKPIPPYSYK